MYSATLHASRTTSSARSSLTPVGNVRPSHYIDMSRQTNKSNALGDDAQREQIIAELSSEVLPKLHEKVQAIGRRFGREWNVDEHLVSVMVAEVLRDGSEVLRDWEVGEATASGQKLNDLAVSLGVSNRQNVRRKATHADKFRDARKAAQLAQADVDVTVGDWRVSVKPESDPR